MALRSVIFTMSIKKLIGYKKDFFDNKITFEIKLIIMFIFFFFFFSFQIQQISKERYSAFLFEVFSILKFRVRREIIFLNLFIFDLEIHGS